MMRTALFITNDLSLQNRIQIMVHDEAAQFFYANTIDDAVEIMDAQEIAVVFMPYGLDVLSGDEMLEIVLDHNPRAQIILLFDDEDLLQVVRAHNNYHICRLISSSNVKLELLPEKINAAFERYNKDDELKEFERNYRLKEDKYKNTLEKMAELLNDRMESYSAIRSMFLLLVKMDIVTFLNEQEQTAVLDYLGRIISEYVSLFLLQETDEDLYVLRILGECHKTDAHRFLMIKADELKQLQDKERLNALFVIRIISLYFSAFYEKYRGKIETEETEDGIVLNIIYECIPGKDYGELPMKLLPFNEAFVKLYADRAAFGLKDRVMQYKMIYKKDVS